MELSYAKGAWEEVYNVHNQGIQMLGQIKHGFCHPRAILFKVLADTIGIDCRLMVVSITISLHFSVFNLILNFDVFFFFWSLGITQGRRIGENRFT